MLYRLRYTLHFFMQAPALGLRHAWYCSGCSPERSDPIEDAETELYYTRTTG